MDNESRDGERSSKDFTVVISRRVKPGYENEYDEWLRRYLMLERKVPGCRNNDNYARRYRFSHKAHNSQI
jgi:antibiotic biosynthesis monooxygenase (ABM) superfamily enzyme